MSRYDPQAISHAFRWAAKQSPAGFADYARGYLAWKLQSADGPEKPYPTPPSLTVDTVTRCIRIRNRLDALLEGRTGKGKI